MPNPQHCTQNHVIKTTAYVCLGLNPKFIKEPLSQAEIILTMNVLVLSSEIYKNCIVDASDIRNMKWNEKIKKHMAVLET